MKHLILFSMVSLFSAVSYGVTCYADIAAEQIHETTCGADGAWEKPAIRKILRKNHCSSNKRVIRKITRYMNKCEKYKYGTIKKIRRYLRRIHPNQASMTPSLFQVFGSLRYQAEAEKSGSGTN